MNNKISFTVKGAPIPKGSVFGFIRGWPKKNWNKAAFEKAIRAIIARIYSGEHPIVDIMPTQKGLEKWEGEIRDEARAAMAPIPEPFRGPCRVLILFYIKRPANHFGRRDKRPYLKEQYVKAYCTKAPDVDKLTRTVFDAMNGVVFIDDSQVVDVAARKLWGKSPGVVVEVEEIKMVMPKEMPNQKQLLLNFGKTEK